jgi:DNA-binding transcriptional MerR regulator
VTQAIWTLDELTERVGAALSVGYHGQPSGRVRDLPDRRAIRWYTTIGLVDRPAAIHGRTAMYGPRHLLQLVAIKRLQAQGRSLVAIQAELAGATDAQLARVAQLPDPTRRAAKGQAAPGAAAAPEAEQPPAASAPPPRRPAALGMAPAVAPSGPAATPAPATARDGAAATPAPATAPDGAPTATPGPAQAPARPARFWRERPAEATTAALPVIEADEVATLRGVRLGERATLLLDPARPLDDADLRAILEAARPLLEALRARGLDGGPHPGREHP